VAKSKQIIFTGISANDFIAEVNGCIMTAVKQAVSKSLHNVSVSYDSGYLSREEAAITLGVSLKTLRDMTLKGEITGFKIKSRLRYKKKDIDLFMATRTIH
jgi:excisionase family DNA binding protein